MMNCLQTVWLVTLSRTWTEVGPNGQCSNIPKHYLVSQPYHSLPFSKSDEVDTSKYKAISMLDCQISILMLSLIYS